MSSCILSEPVNVEDFGVIYFGVQKNVGPAGVVVCIVREDLITDDVLAGTPTMLKWKTQMCIRDRTYIFLYTDTDGWSIH